jgi:hypothetical protein
MEDLRNGGTEEHSGHDGAAHPGGFQGIGDLSTHIATEKEETYVEYKGGTVLRGSLGKDEIVPFD